MTTTLPCFIVFRVLKEGPLRYFTAISIAFAIIMNIFSSDFDCGFKHSHKEQTGSVNQITDLNTGTYLDQEHENTDSDHNDCINCNCLCNQKIAFYNITVNFTFNDDESPRFFISTFLKSLFIELPERPPIIC